jgi:hypothetical protein
VTPIIQLTHFLRGTVSVQAEIVDGRREWTCPDRPMMRPWDDCFFNETPAEIDELLAQAATEFPVTTAKEGVGEHRLSSLA